MDRKGQRQDMEFLLIVYLSYCICIGGVIKGHVRDFHNITGENEGEKQHKN